MMRRELKGRRAIVTGASSGIGRAVALELAHNGVDVVVVARREDRLRELVAQIAPFGRKVEMVVGDITDPQTRQQALDAAQSKLGGLDILVNNAGVGAMGLFEDADPQRVRRVMEVNFFALVEMTRGALPLLKQGVSPMVVNVSSILGHRGVPHSSEYSASKFAVQGFSEAIRAEFTRLGIDVLVISPGTTETEFFDRVIERTAEPNWPKHKPISAAEVARQVVVAIRAGRHEVIPYRWGRVLCWLNRLSPRLVDGMMARYV
jgi:short-subunit dehydrogenase